MRRWWIGAAMLAAGCGGPPVPWDSVESIVGRRTGYAVFDGDDRPAEVDQSVREYLSKPLTAETAARVALLNNRELAVELAEVGIAKADYVTAGQIRNPAISIAYRPPDRRPPSGTDIEASATEDVLDILLLPARKRIAQAALDRSAVRAADAALAVVRETRAAVYRYAADLTVAGIQKQSTDAAAAAADFVHRQADAGNVTPLAVANADADLAMARLELIRVQNQLATDRQAVARLIGVTDESWSVDPTPRPMSAEDPPDVAAAESRRLDVMAVDLQVQLADRAVGYTAAGLLTQVDIGASMERQSDKQTVVGPLLALEVPIFNQKQGQIARANAELSQAKKKRDALRVMVAAEVRAAAARVSAARAEWDVCEKSLIPAREAATRQAQLQYNGMIVGLPTLLATKQVELAAKRRAAEAAADYWTARADLARAMGF